MALNLSFKDLSAVIAISFLMAKMDDDFSEEEFNAILITLSKKYNFEGRDDLLRQYIEYANKMDFKEVVQLISAFGPNEKQFLAEMLAKTMAADGKITSDEADLYQKCIDAFGLPEPSAFGIGTSTNNDRIAPSFLSYSYTYHGEDNYEGFITPHQMSGGQNFQSWLADYSSAKTITKWTETPILKILTEKMRLQSGLKLAMFQTDHDILIHSPNKVGYMLTNGLDIVGSIGFCLWSSMGCFEGFTSRSDMIWLVKAIDTILDGQSLVTGQYAVKYPGINPKQMAGAIDRINKLV